MFEFFARASNLLYCAFAHQQIDCISSVSAASRKKEMVAFPRISPASHIPNPRGWRENRTATDRTIRRRVRMDGENNVKCLLANGTAHNVGKESRALVHVHEIFKMATIFMRSSTAAAPSSKSYSVELDVEDAGCWLTTVNLFSKIACKSNGVPNCRTASTMCDPMRALGV